MQLNFSWVALPSRGLAPIRSQKDCRPTPNREWMGQHRSELGGSWGRTSGGPILLALAVTGRTQWYIMTVARIRNRKVSGRTTGLQANNNEPLTIYCFTRLL